MRMEKNAGIRKRKMGPLVSTRRVSGPFRSKAARFNPSTYYPIFKPPECFSFQALLKTCRKVYHYESFRPNLIWGKCSTVRRDSFTCHSLCLDPQRLFFFTDSCSANYQSRSSVGRPGSMQVGPPEPRNHLRRGVPFWASRSGPRE